MAALLQVIDQGQYAQILTGVTSIFVAIWAIMRVWAVPGIHSRMAVASATT